MSEPTKPSKVLGGWHMPTLRYHVVETIGPGFPPRGATCTAWPWGPTIHRIDETGHCVEFAELNKLEAAGKIKRIEPERKGAKSKPASPASTIRAAAA